MWKMVKANRPQSLPSDYTDELLMAIMWEESTFTNVREVHKDGSFGPASGFGQINVTEYWRFASLGTKDQIRAKILSVEDFSVKLVGLFLADLHSRLKSKSAVLKNGYAGANVNPVNINAYNQWLACEARLLGSNKTGKTGGLVMPVRSEIVDALRLAKPNSDLFINQVVKDAPDTPSP
jgi:hypothetical protein